ncbi:cellulose biosynthesis cyclic di-GMP-binding regulatory protein BcsB [Marinospirillum alkaliphilum]|uniref:Cyclic di-GMP-binding protein n=1 Tax=Marinospirillum alkaliphilum DSM 21637 TaxID=1122209 RepID=A0A1K1VYZ8_9GAMM|nr:cellulose biosynthesis cyclic di-GMP-binding regulatory protein BcsB [Marinospirillum alkaliphilum]SFX29805.1 SH3 domain-containing protein [Marinospirillum alkaliphilum DSM 21637]
MYRCIADKGRGSRLLLTGLLVLALLAPLNVLASVWEVSAATANARVSPAADAALVTQLERGEQVQLLARQGGWMQVQLAQGSRVWIHQSSLTEVADAAVTQREVLRLSNFSAASGPVRLFGNTEKMEIFLPVSETREMLDATLSLRMVNSIALQASRSFMVVRFNETTLAQVPFNPNQPISDARVRLPAELWRGGFNKLTLEVTQHYTDRCEDATAPELWTELDLFHSRLELTHRAVDRKLTLSDLSSLFSPGVGGYQQALLVTAPSAEGGVNTGKIYSQALPLAAQALALRRQYASLELQHRVWQAEWPEYEERVAGMQNVQLMQAFPYLSEKDAAPFHVLLGTRDELQALLSESELSKISGPHLQLQEVAAIRNARGELLVPGGIRLLVTGTTETEVLDAARLLTEMDDRLNPVPQITLLGRELNNETLPVASGQFLHPGRSYTFAALGAGTTSFQNMGQNRLRVNLPLPANYYAVESDHVELQLDFGYGAGMGPGAVMNVNLNGEYVHGLLLSESNGAAFRGYRIRLPVRKLNPGLNTLDFDVTMRPELVVGECAGVPGTHLIFQMLGSSTVTLPKAGAVAVQPDLALFGATGFPYISPTAKNPTEILLASEALTASALTLVGRMAQSAQAPLEQLQLQVGMDQRPTGHALVFATPEMLPQDLFKEWNASLGRTQVWPYRTLNDLRDGLQSGFGVSRAQAETRGEVLRGRIHQQGQLGDLGVMAAFRNPYTSQAATVTVVTAQTEALLQQRVLNLVDSSLWSQLRGDLLIWRDTPENIVSMQVANRYELGERSTWMKLRMTLSHNPWFWLGGVLLILVLVSWLAVRLLRQRKAAMEQY